MPELRPCPLCGGNPKIVQRKVKDVGRIKFVEMVDEHEKPGTSERCDMSGLGALPRQRVWGLREKRKDSG